MSSTFGKNIRISIFGQSHSDSIGVVMDGLPAGHKIDFEELMDFMSRRAPGRDEYSTPRFEEDAPEVLSGLKDDVLCGAPLAMIIKNKNIRPSDYSDIQRKARPGHADYTSWLKYGDARDHTGGGHFSGRLTAPLCIAGGIILQLLAEEEVYVGAHINEISTVRGERFDPIKIRVNDFNAIRKRDFPVHDIRAGELMKREIESAKQDLDSVGGVIECAVLGFPAGVGSPMFNGLENDLSAALFAIPAVKGIEFGSGFDGSRTRGSANNDPFIIKDGEIETSSNNHGGILGGISSGMPIIFRVAIKPTSSIGIEQKTVDFVNRTESTIAIKGRHDPCIVQRAVPCVEAASAIALYDSLLDFKNTK